MTNEDPKLEENEESTLDENRESEEASEDNLFDEEEEKEEPISRKEFNELVKGVKNLATQKGREKKEEPKKSDYAEEILLSKNPEAKQVLEELRQMAKDTKTDVIQAYKKSSWLKQEAKTRQEAKKEEGKVITPSSNVKGEKSVDVVLSEQDKALIKAQGWTPKEYAKKRDKYANLDS